MTDQTPAAYAVRVLARLGRAFEALPADAGTIDQRAAVIGAAVDMEGEALARGWTDEAAQRFAVETIRLGAEALALAAVADVDGLAEEYGENELAQDRNPTTDGFEEWLTRRRRAIADEIAGAADVLYPPAVR